MKLKLFFFLFIPVLFFAQTTQSVDPITGIAIPAGFNWLYLIFYVLGMVIHYGVKVFHTLGLPNLLPNLAKNFVGWFFNKFHYTLIAGAAAAIIGLVESYGLNVGFDKITLMGVCASIAAGYIGDSVFNSGEIK